MDAEQKIKPTFKSVGKNIASVDIWLNKSLNENDTKEKQQKKTQTFVSSGLEKPNKLIQGMIVSKRDDTGEIQKVPCIRVPQDIDHEAVYKELLKWTPDAKPPKAVLSLTGGSTHFLNNETLVSRLKSGLLNLITTTSLWIFTGGTNYGITTSVGEAVREYKEKNDKNDHIMAFGFLPWVENLKNIEPNHTHFVMVDGSKDKASELRTKLRSYFKKRKIPVILLIVEGGYNTFDRVLLSVKSDMPVLIIDGSGKAADFISKGYRLSENKTSDESSIFTETFTSEILPLAKRITTDTDIDPIKLVEQLKECLQKRKMINVFSLDDNNETLDRMIQNIFFMIRNEDNKMDTEKKIKLVNRWNRPDIAEKEIFNMEKRQDIEKIRDSLKNKDSAVSNLFRKSLVDNRKDFVTLVLKYILETKCYQQFVTENLSSLYSECMDPGGSCRAGQLLEEYIQSSKQRIWKRGENKINTSDSQNLDIINKAVMHLLGNNKLQAIAKEEHRPFTSKDPFKELFIWAVLMNRKEMAKLFWKKDRDFICAALYASSLAKKLEKTASSEGYMELTKYFADDSRDEDDNLNGPSITVSFDGAWQKRGSGRSYSSLTGHATMIGEKTGKCVSQGTKSADCRKCMYVDEKGDGQHDCRKNHSGSAKSMEPNLAVEMVQDLQCKGCTVSCIIMDDDTTTLARLKQNINSDIVKRSDKNHQRKNIVSDLYRLHEKHKGKLSTSTISYLTKDLDYAIAQNQNHAEQLSQNIYAIIPHSFGDHSHCDLSWCNYHKDPENYKHKSLPYGKDLNGEEMFADLSKLFDSYAKNSHKLANCGSSQGNESLNQIIALKAPKAKHFGSSQSLPFRVCVGVIQKNEGRSYIPQVYEAHNLSPGKFTVMHTAKIDKKRKHDKVNASTREAKRKRLVKKGKFNINLKAKEIREGITYATSISAPGNSIEKADDISPIPDPEPEVTEDPVSLKDETFVYFDLETTGFGTDCDIIQLAAAYANQNYNRYMVPSQRISPSASKVTGFSKSGLILYKNGEIMQTDEEPEIFKQFISWLPKKCILIGHNSKIFDSRILTKALQNNNVMKDFELKCVGFIDTLSLTKELLPDRKTSKQSYNQESLVKDIVGISYDAHNAIGDVQSLQQLINTLKVSPRMLEKHSFSVRYTVNMISKLQLTKSRLESFNNIPSSFCSKTMLNKIAKSGLRLNHLILAGNRGGVDGIRELLTEQIDGKPRVTKDKKILDSISEHIMSLQN